MSEGAPSERDSLFETQTEAIIAFVTEHKLTSEELFTAYQIALGVSPEEKEVGLAPKEEVFELARQMDDQMKNGMPLNWVVGLIDSKREYEALPDLYRALVQTLSVTEREKRVLSSILDHKRSGVLTIFEQRTHRELESVTIPAEVLEENYTLNSIAMHLMEFLSKFKDSEIEISFVES